MKLDTSYLERCIDTLERAYAFLLNEESGDIEYDIYRSACVKEFEIILEQSGKLLKKVIKPYFPSTKVADNLYYKDVFREAVLRSIISSELCERFLEYRDHRNISAHDYGVNFAEEILQLIPNFISDTRSLVQILNLHSDDIERQG